MVELFGVDIAKEVNDAMGADLLAGTLTAKTEGDRTAASLSAGPAEVSKKAPFRGIVEDYEDKYVNGTTILRGDRRVLILGASLPTGTVPHPGDTILILNRTYEIVGPVASDPAEATYSCQVRGQ